jgi:CRP/FNR family transcriptional regulator, cyclic AMP receptor protein
MKLGKNSKVDLIRHVPLFAACSKKELAEIASIADEIDLPADKVLMEQGGQGREFFVLIEGTADVIQDGRTVNSMGPGDFFGEIALVAKTPRTATIKATSPLRALVINDRAFRALLEHSPKIQLGVLQALAERVAQTNPT